jgi:hypothetical protein
MAFAYRAALTPAGFSRYEAERSNIAFLNANNNFTGNNTFFNVTYLNQNTVVYNTTYNISNIAFNNTNILGSALTGSGGDISRTYAISMDLVAVDNAMLQPTYDYTSAGGIVTFLNPVWDDQHITFWDTQLLVTYTNYLGSAGTGVDGQAGRTITANNVQLVAVDNQVLHPGIDYTLGAGTITFLNPLWNDQHVTIWHY